MREKEPKFEKIELSKEEKVAKEKIMEIIENSKYWTPETQKEVGQEMEENFEEDSQGLGGYFTEKLEWMSKDYEPRQIQERTVDVKKDQFSWTRIQKAYYNKFRNKHNKESGKEVRTLNNFWARITDKPLFVSIEGFEFFADYEEFEGKHFPKEKIKKEVEKLDDYLKKEFPKKETFELEEIKKDVRQAIDKFYGKEAKELLQLERDYDWHMERIALYALIEKIIKEHFGMSREEFAGELKKYFGMGDREKNLPPKEFAEKFVDWENKTFEVYEEALKLAEVKPEDVRWTG